jgi:hypothetical protein
LTLTHNRPFSNFSCTSQKHTKNYYLQYQAFAPVPTFTSRTISTSSSLSACRVNAKKEKRVRNRENMRKFKKRGKISRKKMMRKLQSNEARAIENEFIAKCFTTVVIEEEGNNKRR